MKSLRKPIMLALFIGVELLWAGCAMVPDSVNYTYSRSRVTGEETDYFGASWDIPKPSRK